MITSGGGDSVIDGCEHVARRLGNQVLGYWYVTPEIETTRHHVRQDGAEYSFAQSLSSPTYLLSLLCLDDGRMLITSICQMPAYSTYLIRANQAT